MGWETAVVLLMGALTILAGAVTAYFQAKAREITKRLDDVHTLVNSQRDLLLQQISDLKAEIVVLKDRNHLK